MSSLHDVARLAGVSKSLVSRVVNHQSGVSAENRRKILEAMKALNYKPNALARSLVMGRTNIIGVVMDSLCEPFFFPFIHGLEEAVNQTGFDLVFTSGQDLPQYKEAAARFFLQGRADGIILYGSRLAGEHLIRSLAEQTLPIVVVENHLSDLDLYNVCLDNHYGSKLAVEHLFACGCSSIGYVIGDPSYRVTEDRLNGFLQAMETHGIQVPPHMLIQANFSIKDSYEAMLAYLKKAPRCDLPEGFCCCSDNTAYGVISALEDSGLHVPDDVKVVGFDDDLPPRDYRHAALTTVSQPLHQMARCAVELLLQQIRGQESSPRKVVLLPELVIRDSSGLHAER